MVLHPGAVATRAERLGPGGPRGRGSVSSPGVEIPAALRDSDDSRDELGAEPPNRLVVEHQLSIFHGA
jgi:hypothetical protein